MENSEDSRDLKNAFESTSTKRALEKSAIKEMISTSSDAHFGVAHSAEEWIFDRAFDRNLFFH